MIEVIKSVRIRLINQKKSQEVIIHLTFESINRGDSSIKTYCENNGVNNWLDFITFTSYRTAQASNAS